MNAVTHATTGYIHPAIRSEIETITPSTAASWLAVNAHNRPVSPETVSAYARDMDAGRWVVNGEGIKLSSRGAVLDGQHRLRAVIKSGATIRSLVVRGLDEGVFQTLDTGKRRSMGDVLAIAGESNTVILAGAIRYQAQHDAGTFDGAAGGGMKNVSYTACMEAYARHPGLREATTAIVNRFRTTGSLIGHSLASFLLYQFNRQNPHKSDQFFYGLESGTFPEDGAAIHYLRERLIQNKASKRRLNRTELAAYVVKTWRAYRDQKTLTRLRFAQTGKSAEPFPSLID